MMRYKNVFVLVVYSRHCGDLWKRGTKKKKVETML